MRLGARLIVLMSMVALFSLAAMMSKLLRWDAYTNDMLVRGGVVCTAVYFVVVLYQMTRVRRRRRY
ncbi:MAG: hypothetical protein B7Y84_05505 [Azorhizobium sp. 32-67-21]|nr:MAG: hypothetical protein B7Z30_01045 [Rhizobiales bacterium 12-68-15]OYX89347.1 MAG: hypothetical protein B7Y84_05505 [Azorhizobium sp. 32-67-21]